MNKYAKAIINWQTPERPNSSQSCRLSSLLWARLLLSSSRVIFKDGTSQEFLPASLEHVAVEELYEPQGPDLKPTAEILKCAVFTITSQQPDLRVRVRAYHAHDGAEFGHPGPMRLEAKDTREWDRVYHELQNKLNTIIRQAEVVK